jgi:hypothetical protein
LQNNNTKYLIMKVGYSDSFDRFGLGEDSVFSEQYKKCRRGPVAGIAPAGAPSGAVFKPLPLNPNENILSNTVRSVNGLSAEDRQRLTCSSERLGRYLTAELCQRQGRCYPFQGAKISIDHRRLTWPWFY